MRFIFLAIAIALAASSCASNPEKGQTDLGGGLAYCDANQLSIFLAGLQYSVRNMDPDVLEFEREEFSDANNCYLQIPAYLYNQKATAEEPRYLNVVTPQWDLELDAVELDQ